MLARISLRFILLRVSWICIGNPRRTLTTTVKPDALSLSVKLINEGLCRQRSNFDQISVVWSNFYGKVGPYITIPGLDFICHYPKGPNQLRNLKIERF